MPKAFISPSVKTADEPAFNRNGWDRQDGVRSGLFKRYIVHV